MAQLQVVVVTPEATVLEEAADFVALPLEDGEIGIAPLHSPLIGRLGYGELRLVAANHTRRFYVDGGFVQVANDVVSVLTTLAKPAEALDAAAASELLAQSLAATAHSEEKLAWRERAQRQARAQLRVASGNK